MDPDPFLNLLRAGGDHDLWLAGSNLSKLTVGQHQEEHNAYIRQDKNPPSSPQLRPVQGFRACVNSGVCDADRQPS